MIISTIRRMFYAGVQYSFKDFAGSILESIFWNR